MFWRLKAYGTWVTSLFRRNRPIDWQQVNRVLIIRHKFIGDTILLEPFIRACRAFLPKHVELDVLVAKGSGELLEGHPDITRLHYFDAQYLASLKKVSARHYDVAFVLKRSLTTALLALKLGIPIRIGFNTEGRSPLLTHPVSYTGDIHESEAFMNVLRAVGGFPPPVAIGDWSFSHDPLPDDLQATVDEYKREGRRCILLHATASNLLKAWPIIHWKLFFGFLKKRLPELPPLAFIMLGAPSDASTYNDLFLFDESDDVRVHNLCGELSLRQSMTLMPQLDMAIGVDSGTLHMASTGGMPIISLFGPMSEKRWHPLLRFEQGNLEGKHLQNRVHIVKRALPCQPCHLKTPCTHDLACLNELMPVRLLEVFIDVLQSLDTHHEPLERPILHIMP